MIRVRYLVISSAAVLAAGTSLIPTSVETTPEPDPEAITLLAARSIPNVPGKRLVSILVEYPPGGASAPHRHDAHVFVYVLEGKLRMQADGQAPVTLAPGETFYESPSDVHRISANASATEPTRFVVFMVKDAGRATTSPVPQPAAP